MTLPVVTPAFIERRIYLIRRHKVMLDSDLADLYGVPTKRLNEQVKRNCLRRYRGKQGQKVGGVVRKVLNF
jgi:ORF6N domain